MSAGIAPGGRATSGPVPAESMSAGSVSSPSLPQRQLSVADASAGQLLALASDGAQAAWDEIVRRYERLVWSVARAHRLESSDAADAVQTTWLRLVEHLGSIHDPDRLGAWLATTARRESLRIVGRRKRERQDAADDELAVLADDGIGVEESLLGSERDAMVLRAVRELEPRCQQLLRVLSASPPPRYEAVAEAFGMPIGSIGPTRGRCLHRLKDVLLAMGFESSWQPGGHQ
jgi:RNA polymerase sigma factor (sigma-70 family)